MPTADMARTRRDVRLYAYALVGQEMMPFEEEELPFMQQCGLKRLRKNRGGTVTFCQRKNLVPNPSISWPRESGLGRAWHGGLHHEVMITSCN